MGTPSMKYTNIFSLGDRFTNPEKDWIVVASESPWRPLVMRRNLNLHNILTMRSGFPETLMKEDYPCAGEYSRATADGKAKMAAQQIFSATTDEEKAKILAQLKRPYDDMPPHFDVSKIKFVIGADTVSECNGEIFEKPSDAADAKKQMMSYQKHSPKITTGISVYCRDKGTEMAIFSFYEVMTAHFQKMSEADIEEYVKLNEWVGVAGSYKINGFGEAMIERIEGSHTTSMGMPANKFSQHLCAYIREFESAD